MEQQSGSKISKISLVFPTRGRPEKLNRLVKSVQQTATSMPDIAVYIDSDDEWSAIAARELGLSFIQGPRHLLSSCYNEALKLAVGEIVMFAADDLIFREKAWDEIVIKEFEKVADKILFVTSWDGLRPDKLGTHGFLHRNWINAVGYLLPPYFGTWYVDNWITTVAESVQRKVYLDCMIAEHMHHTNGKAEYDTTYVEATARQEEDGRVWSKMQNKLREDIEKLKRVMQ